MAHGSEVLWGEGRRWYNIQPGGLKKGLEDRGIKGLSERAENEVGAIRFLNPLNEEIKERQKNIHSASK